jgi:hypothetical protein
VHTVIGEGNPVGDYKKRMRSLSIDLNSQHILPKTDILVTRVEVDGTGYGDAGQKQRIPSNQVLVRTSHDYSFNVRISSGGAPGINELVFPGGGKVNTETNPYTIILFKIDPESEILPGYRWRCDYCVPGEGLVHVDE